MNGNNKIKLSKNLVKISYKNLIWCTWNEKFLKVIKKKFFWVRTWVVNHQFKKVLDKIRCMSSPYSALKNLGKKDFCNKQEVIGTLMSFPKRVSQAPSFSLFLRPLSSKMLFSDERVQMWTSSAVIFLRFCRRRILSVYCQDI